MRVIGIPLLALVAAGLMALSGSPARAQSVDCEATMSDIAFGTVSLRTGVSNETSGVLSISCTGVGTVGVCVYFGAGSGGSGAGLSPRYMRRADNAALAFQLRPAGNGPSGGIWDGVYFEMPALVNGSVDIPVFADVVSTGVGTGTGPYASVFTGLADVRLEFNTSACGQAGMVRAINPFTVSATVADSCEVDAGTLDFGTLGPATTGHVDASTVFFMRCTDATAYTVRLDNGTGAGASGPTDRRMTGPSSQLRYGLYKDAARSLPWGDGAGTSISSNGTGSDQGMTVFGRLFGGQSLLSGTYVDSVLITVEY